MDRDEDAQDEDTAVTPMPLPESSDSRGQPTEAAGDRPPRPSSAGLSAAALPRPARATIGPVVTAATRPASPVVPVAPRAASSPAPRASSSPALTHSPRGTSNPAAIVAPAPLAPPDAASPPARPTPVPTPRPTPIPTPRPTPIPAELSQPSPQAPSPQAPSPQVPSPQISSPQVPSPQAPSPPPPQTTGPTTDAGLREVKQVDDHPNTAQIYNAPPKRITIGEFQAPLPPSDSPSTMVESLPDAGPAVADFGSSLARYTLGEILGRGGMGEVFSARDEQIGRPVAIKRLRSAEPSADALARFLREARIQGRLEHPAIVPVHELWKDELGRPFFVMKQLAGVTLADVLAKLAFGSPETQKQFSRARLLRAFADVCLAIEFAHTRGVVHRDLKPANIVLGDFGEVYVLDWGVARMLSEEERPSFADVGTIEFAAYNETAAGSILGTPGYISPEQIRGDSDLDGRADVYALGSILFEILTLYPLHPRGQGAIASALSGVDARPSRRALDRVVPPELDAICVRATALERHERFPTARALGDAVVEFLDGDRDFVLRRELARTELATARKALASGNGQKQKRIAIRAAARALAFDPTSPQPADLLGRLMLEPPTEIPKEVEDELARADLESLKKSAQFGMLAAFAYLLFFPILFWIGFRESWYHVVGPGLCLFIVTVELWLAPKNPYWSGYLTITANLAMILLLSWIVSPFLIGAGPATVIVMLLANHRRLINTWLLAGLSAVATLAPWVIETIAGAPARAEVDGSSFVLHTGAANLDSFGSLFGLVLYTVVLIGLATVLARIQDNERRTVRRNLQLQAWQLRELIPRPENQTQ